MKRKRTTCCPACCRRHGPGPSFFVDGPAVETVALWSPWELKTLAEFEYSQDVTGNSCCLSHKMFNLFYCLFEYSANYTLQIKPASGVNPEHLNHSSSSEGVSVSAYSIGGSWMHTLSSVSTK